MTKLTFDDILISPAYSDIESRQEINLSQEFLGINLAIPVISANMDYVTGAEMAIAMRREGGLGILHRFYSTLDERKRDIDRLALTENTIAISVGTKLSEWPDPVEYLDNQFSPALRVVCVDVAHGFHKKVAHKIRQLKDEYPSWKVIAGNVATADGARFLEQAGADAIKVGIGPGSVCTTRIVTGVGVPQLSAVLECADAVDIPIIADGGIRYAGDITKALVAGADVVMLGNLLAGASETPVEAIQTGDGRRLKPYRGQSIFGSNDKIYTHEGISGFVEEKGPVKNILHQLMGGLRSGMSYVGARNLEELRYKANFIEISHSTLEENRTRILTSV
jgi:IMP dehydrogenase